MFFDLFRVMDLPWCLSCLCLGVAALECNVEREDMAIAAAVGMKWESMQSFVTEVCFHKTPVDYHEPWFPMHGTLFVQERADPHESDNGLLRDDARSPMLAAASRLSYDDVTVCAWKSTTVLLLTMAIGILLCCAARPCRERYEGVSQNVSHQ